MRKGLFLLCLIPFCLKAQHFSQLGRFSIEFEQGCAPVTIKVSQYTNLDKPRSFFYEEGQPDINDTSYTYTQPGTYHIVQLIGEDITPKTDTLTFTVVDPPTPDYDIYYCTSNQVEISITDDFYDSYRIYFSSTDSIDILKSDPNPRYTFPSADNNISVKGLLDNSFNGSCGINERSFSIPSTLSLPTVDTAYLAYDCDNTYTLNLQLDNTTNFKYSIGFEESLSSGNWLYEGLINQSISVSDISLGTEIEKCVYVMVTDICNGDSIVSSPYCISVDYAEFAHFEGAYASYVGDDILIDLADNRFYPVEIARSNNSGSFNVIDSTEIAEYTDPNSSSSSYQYRLRFVSVSCDNTASVELAPPRVRLKSFDRAKNQMTLEVKDPVNQLDETGMTISLLQYSRDSSEINEVDFTNPFALDPLIGEFQYARLKYNYLNGATVYSNAILGHLNYVLYVPKAFTPYNQDGLNDRLEFFGLPTDEGEFKIYNRWGELVFESTEVSTGWDGYTKRGRVPEGSYRYKVTFRTPNGDMKSQVGSFVLIRN